MFRVGGKKKALVIGLLLVLIAADVLVIFENSPKPTTSTGKINPGKLVDYTKVFNAKLANPSSYVGIPSVQKKIAITIALRWRNEGELNKSLEMINNPRSPMYHHFYSWSEFKKLYAPSDNVYDSIVDWLKNQGLNIEHTYPLHNAITIYDTIGKIQKVFHTEFGLYRGDGKHHRLEYYAIKKPIKFPRNFIQYIVGIDGFNNATVYHLNYYTSSSGTDYLTGADVAKMYRVFELYNDTPDGSASSKHIFATGLRVATVLWEGSTSSGEAAPFDPDAVNYYYQHVIPKWIQNLGVMSHVWGHGVASDTVPPGSDTDGQVSVENELDLEMIGTVAPGADVVCVYTDSSQSNFPDANYDYILNTLAENSTLVAVSNSWGDGDQTESSDTMNDVKALNAMGVTVLASSGDDGDTDSPSEPSTAALSTYGFIAVGGTTPFPNGIDDTTLEDYATMGYNTNTANPRSSEVVWYDISSTNSAGDHWGTQSGVSSVYAEPWFQKDYVDSIIGLTGSHGRATADISAMGNHTLIYTSSSSGLSWSSVAGTSVACPVTAGMIAEMAAYVGVQYGISGHGFGYFLPTLYQLGNDFYNNNKYANSPPFFDVTETPNGYHNGETAYDARTGWDLASGWGVINAWELIHDIGFILSSSSTSATITAGQTASYTIDISFPYMWTCKVGHFEVSGLPAGASVSSSVSYVQPPGNGTAASFTLNIATAPSTPAGTYDLNLTAYSYNQTNGHWGNLTNYIHLTLTVNPANAPDLTISSISASPTTVNEGETITIQATVKNVGNAEAYNVSVGFYYDKFDSSHLIHIVNAGNLTAGASNTVETTWDTTGHVGEHTIIAYADPDNAIEETNEDNNSANTTVIVNGYGVNLTVDSTAKTVQPGGSVDYTITVKNTGTLQDTFDLSTSPVSSGWSASLSQNSVTLNAGESTNIILTVTAPSSATQGESQNVTVTAVSEGNSSKSDSVTTTTTVVTLYITNITIYNHLDAVINYTTNENVTSYIVYGIGPNHMKRQTPEETTASKYHEFALQNLTPEITYYFKIYMSDGTNSAWSNIYHFTLNGTNDFEYTDNPEPSNPPNSLPPNWQVIAWNYSSGNSEPSIWQWGAPSNVGPSSAHSGSDLIGTILNGNYGVDEQVQALLTPWIDLRNASWVTLSFYAWYDLEEDSSGMWDGVTMAFENDSGTTWWLLDPNNNASQYDGICASDQGLNDTYIFGGSSGGWVLKTFNTTTINDVNVNRNLLGHKVRFIFYFESDEYVHNYPGFYLDDIQIKTGIPQYHIYGYVKDSSGNAVSGATVWVNDTTLGTSYQTTTDSSGRYDIYTYNGISGDSINVDASSTQGKGTNTGSLSQDTEIDITLQAVPELNMVIIPILLLAAIYILRRRK